MEGALRIPTTEATQFVAEGSMVALVTCKICGTAILIDPRDRKDDFDPIAVHAKWHDEEPPREAWR